MNSLFAVIAEREADARVVAEELHAQIAWVTEHLDAVQAELSRLAVTRETAMSLGYAEPDDAATADAAIAQPAYLNILAEFERAVGSLRGPAVPDPRRRHGAQASRRHALPAQAPGRTRHHHRDRIGPVRPRHERATHYVALTRSPTCIYGRTGH